MNSEQSDKIRIGTRKSSLAQAQAQEIRKAIESFFPDGKVEIHKIQTRGDRLVDRSLSKIGGKGLFLKEIQQALFDDEIDIAVHSMKDVPAERPDGLEICAVPRRKPAEDVLVSHGDVSLDNLPKNAIVGTSSLRRKSQLLAYRPDLVVKPLRGNINTRLNKLLQSDEFAAIILAKAGLIRAGLEGCISQEISPEIILPGIGQGALAVEIKSDKNHLREKLNFLEDFKTRVEITAERQFLRTLEGSCHVPIGALAVLKNMGSNYTLTLDGVVASLNGAVVLKDQGIKHFSSSDLNYIEINYAASSLGKELAASLIEQGAGKIIREAEEEVE